MKKSNERNKKSIRETEKNMGWHKMANLFYSLDWRTKIEAPSNMGKQKMNILDYPRFWIKDRFGNPMVCGDNPDPRDYHAGRAPKQSVGFPRIVSSYHQAKDFGFMIKKQSKNSCTAYSEIMRAEMVNILEHSRNIILDAELQWKFQLQTGASVDSGDWIQNAKKQFHKNPQGYYQTEYRRIYDRSLTEIKTWLVQRKQINSGLYWKWLKDKRMTNYEWMMKTGEYVPAEGESLGGHAILLTGYNDDTGMIEFIESEKTPNETKKHDDGEFHVSYENYIRLMSMYISFDAIDKEVK